MRILVTGSSGHLGEALMRTLRAAGREAVGLDLRPGPFTDRVGSIADAGFVRAAMRGAGAVLHAATLHKPQVATRPMADFVEANVSGTLALLEAAVAEGAGAFVFTSTTSAFGEALRPAPDAPAVWLDEATSEPPKNIYGATKSAAEDLCRLVHRMHGLPVVVLRASRFFPERDDDPATRDAYADANAKANEYLYRRVEIGDVVSAHLCALDRAAAIGFGRFVVSATTPFRPEDAAELRRDAPAVLSRRVPGWEAAYARLGWRMFPGLDRVYDNRRARETLGWRPEFDFARVLAQAEAGEPLGGPMTRAVGAKGYPGAGEAYRPDGAAIG